MSVPLEWLELLKNFTSNTHVKIKITYCNMLYYTQKAYRVSQKKVGAKNRTLWRITKKSSKFWEIFIIQTSRELQNTYK
jgi:hypothetical protein